MRDTAAESAFELHFRQRMRYNYYQLSFSCPHGVNSLTSNHYKLPCYDCPRRTAVLIVLLPPPYTSVHLTELSLIFFVTLSNTKHCGEYWLIMNPKKEAQVVQKLFDRSTWSAGGAKMLWISGRPIGYIYIKPVRGTFKETHSFQPRSTSNIINYHFITFTSRPC